MKHLLFTVPLAFALAGSPALALDPELTDINRTAFDTIDVNGDGQLSHREIDQYRGLVMLSQDADDDGIVSFDEYMAWDMGWRAIAEARGSASSLRDARTAVFAFWDKDGNGQLSPAEQMMSQTTDFYTATGNTNRPLDFDSFAGRLRIIAEMNAALTGPEPVTLINVFEVPQEKLEETIAMWEAARDFLQRQPGYLSTALHQSLLPDARFRLINVAEWRDPDSYAAATAAMRREAGLEQVEGLDFNAALYRVVRTD